MSATPGPNNIMLLASGAQFGYRNTLPHIIGIVLGVALLLASVLFGLGIVFKLYPPFYTVLKVVGGTYLLWLAWKVTTAPTHNAYATDTSVENRPMSIFMAISFQFVNPKAWAMAMTAVSTFTLPGTQYIQSSLFIMASFAVVGFFSISGWAYLGVALQRFLTTQTRRRNFNWIMGLCTAATLVMVIVD